MWSQELHIEAKFWDKTIDVNSKVAFKDTFGKSPFSCTISAANAQTSLNCVGAILLKNSTFFLLSHCEVGKWQDRTFGNRLFTLKSFEFQSNPISSPSTASESSTAIPAITHCSALSYRNVEAAEEPLSQGDGAFRRKEWKQFYS